MRQEKEETYEKFPSIEEIAKNKAAEVGTTHMFCEKDLQETCGD